MHARYATLSADNFPTPLLLNSSDLNESKTTLWKTLGGAAPLLCGCILFYNLKSFSSFLSSVLLKSCGCFSQYNFQSFSRCFIRHRSHPWVEFFDLASHRFQFGFTCAAFPFYFSSSLQLFGSFFIHNNTVKSCFEGYVLWSPKILYFLLGIKAVNTVSGLFSQSNQFLLQTIYQGQNSNAARMRTAVDAYI